MTLVVQSPVAGAPLVQAALGAPGLQGPQGLQGLPGGVGRRNWLMNGRAAIWQRGTSFAGGGPANERVCDRFQIGRGSRAVAVARSTDVPDARFPFSIEGTWSGASGYAPLYQIVEGGSVLAGSQVTLSQFVKGPAGATIAAGIGVPGGGQGTTFGAHVCTGAWDLYQRTITCPALSGANALVELIAAPGAAGVYRVTGAQLEIASAATAFELRPFGDDLRDCQRYLFSTFGNGVTPAAAAGNTTAIVENLGLATVSAAWRRTFHLPAALRVPVLGGAILTLFNPVNASGQLRLGNRAVDLTASQPLSFGHRPESVCLFAQTPSSGTFAAGDDVIFHMTIDAEF